MTTPWQDAIDEFELRFIDIPFNMEVINKPDAILHSQTPTLQFSFKGKTVDRDFLVKDVLSQGEKRAFYLLHIIFEIKIRQTISEDTLFIIDDIADSFDYKNKYAIVEYLNDLRKEENFYCIILTHNFDFHRTISSRLGICRENRLHANKERDDIKLIQEVYQKPPFETWKNCMKACTYYDQSYTDFHALKHIIALIPFVRNLIQYGDDKEENDFSGIDKDYILLTQLLHVKDNTKDIKFTHLKKIYKQYLGKDDFDSSISDSDSIYDAIISTANRISSNDFHLENKIILAIAIRLEAEKYMFSQVTDKNYISGHQTRKLFNRYKDEFKLNTDKIRILEKVNIITPENIHLNSFMYEPILDMSINQLKNLYSEVN